MTKDVRLIWRYGDVDVMYEQTLEGAGSVVTQPLMEFINSFRDGRRFTNALDCFAGVGFMGFALVAEDICDSVCFVDLSSEAVGYVQSNIELNQLGARAHAYVSDILSGVPAGERFDLVVANPPWYFAVDSSHPLSPLAKLKGDRVVQDSGWRIHKSFYEQIAAHLNPGALLFVVEAEPNNSEVTICGSSLDVRPEAPYKLFDDMIRRGGLTHIADRHFWTDTWGEKIWVQVSQMPG